MSPHVGVILFTWVTLGGTGSIWGPQALGSPYWGDPLTFWFHWGAWGAFRVPRHLGPHTGVTHGHLGPLGGHGEHLGSPGTRVPVLGDPGHLDPLGGQREYLGSPGTWVPILRGLLNIWVSLGGMGSFWGPQALGSPYWGDPWSSGSPWWAWGAFGVPRHLGPHIGVSPGHPGPADGHGELLGSRGRPRSPGCHRGSRSIGHNEVIGMCRVGSDAEGPGREHWAEMLANPRKPIEHWHTLVEVRPPRHPWDPPAPMGSPSTHGNSQHP